MIVERDRRGYENGSGASTLGWSAAQTRRVPPAVSRPRSAARQHAGATAHHPRSCARCRHLALSSHPAVRGCLRRHATSIQTGIPARPRQGAAGIRPALGHRGLHGSRLLQPRELQRALHAPNGRDAFGVSTANATAHRRPWRLAAPDARVPDPHEPPATLFVVFVTFVVFVRSNFREA